MCDLWCVVLLFDVGSDVKVVFFWGLLDFGQNVELKCVLVFWCGEVENDFVYWGVYVVVGLQLFDVNLVLCFLGCQGKLMQVDLFWLLVYVDVCEMVGQVDVVWVLCCEVWWLLWCVEDMIGKGKVNLFVGCCVGMCVMVGDGDVVLLEEDVCVELCVWCVLLVQMFGFGDLLQCLLIELLCDDCCVMWQVCEGGSVVVQKLELGDIDMLLFELFQIFVDKCKQVCVSDQFVFVVVKEVVLGWVFLQEVNDLVCVWLLQQYMCCMMCLVYVEIFIVLVECDLQMFNWLFDDMFDCILFYNCIDVNVMMDCLGEVQCLLFEGLIIVFDDV